MASAVGRLTKRPEFLRVASTHRKWVASGLILQAAPRHPGKSGQASVGEVRVGFTVSRKVGKAVARNRVRRRLRAVAATVMPELGRPGYDYVLIGRAATLSRRYADLVADLQTAMRRLGASQIQVDERGKARSRASGRGDR